MPPPTELQAAFQEERLTEFRPLTPAEAARVRIGADQAVDEAKSDPSLRPSRNVRVGFVYLGVVTLHEPADESREPAIAYAVQLIGEPGGEAELETLLVWVDAITGDAIRAEANCYGPLCHATPA